MISYDEAKLALLSQASYLRDEKIALEAALGRILSTNVYSAEALPAFTQAAMDGFALKAEMTKDCSKENRLSFKIAGSLTAGAKPPSTPLCFSNCAYEIMTGALIPNEYDTVIPFEQAECTSEHLFLSLPVAPKLNIRYPGEDIQKGDLILSRGTPIGPQQMMALASLGMTEIPVFTQPKLAILTTGNELVSMHQKTLEIGQVRQSNGFYIKNFLSLLGLQASVYGPFGDDSKSFEGQIKKLLADDPPEVILTTGAVSAGKLDFIPALLKRLGAHFIFHKVAMRPGKPILTAKFSEKTFFIGLPGNPLSCAVGMRFFVYPLLRQMRALPPEQPLIGKLTASAIKKENLHFFCKATFHADLSGNMQLVLSQGQESFKILPFLHATCWASLESSKSSYQAGDGVPFYSLNPREIV